MRIERIDDPSDPRLADYRNLRDPHLRRQHGLFIAESREVVRRLLSCRRFRVRSILLTPAALDGLHDLLETADPDIPLLLVQHDLVRGVVGFNFHRGCVAVGERGDEIPPSALLEPPGRRLLLVLEDVTNPDNIGAVFRNAMAFAADGILLSPGSADPLYRKAIRVSIGASLSLPFARLPDWPEDLKALRGAGYSIMALTPHPEAVDVVEFGTSRTVPERLALLLGAEGSGLSTAARATADHEVRIAMRREADSLNVATACGIALHRLARGTSAPL
ncbi:MAG TPA: RNA methyltransferase [Candidatus Methylomirabilis sp.]|nr:RNA methyltransferase [Candidatus Methylomirabilis sp.]